MSLIVDLSKAKIHLRLDHDDDDERLYWVVERASSIVRDYLKVDADEWDIYDTSSAVLPFDVEAAVLLVVEALFDGTEPLSDDVKALLHRHRDPALA